MPNSIFANARAAALTGSLLGEERLSRMIDCVRPADAIKILQEVNFGEGLSVSPSEAETLIEAEERAFTAFVRETAPGEQLKKFLLAQYDYHNAEAVMRAKHLRRDAKTMAGAEGVYPLARLEDKIYADDYSSFGEYLSRALAEADEMFVLGGATGRRVNALFSRAKYRELAALAAGNAMLTQIVSLMADAANIGIALRTRNTAVALDMNVSGGLIGAAELSYLAEESAENIREKFRFSPRKMLVAAALEDFAEHRPLSALERAADGAALSVIDLDRYGDDGARPFLRYCYRKLAELRNVRIIMSCLNNGVEKAVLRARVRNSV